jgi:hypothetical protein
VAENIKVAHTGRIGYNTGCYLEIRKEIQMAKLKNYVLSVCCGDTYLDVYGYGDEDEDDVGYIGSVDIEDVCIADTEISVLEMIHSLNWAKFNDSVQEVYQTMDKSDL